MKCKKGEFRNTKTDKVTAGLKPCEMKWTEMTVLFLIKQEILVSKKKAMHDANKHMQHFWSLSEMMSDFKSLDRLIKAINQIKNGEERESEAHPEKSWQKGLGPC